MVACLSYLHMVNESLELNLVSIQHHLFPVIYWPLPIVYWLQTGF